MSRELFDPIAPTSARRHAPATARNRAPILEVLRRTFDRQGLVLEIASGTGEHAVHFAENLPHVQWQPSDPDEAMRASIDAWAAEARLPNLRQAIELDAAAERWPIDRADYVLSINMIHIAPWAACEGLMRGASRILPAGGKLVLYGPFREGGRHTAPSNERFDEDLRRRNPAWGVRDLEEVIRLAATRGLAHVETVEMPANNRMVIFARG